MAQQSISNNTFSSATSFGANSPATHNANTSNNSTHLNNPTASTQPIDNLVILKTQTMKRAKEMGLELSDQFVNSILSASDAQQVNQIVLNHIEITASKNKKQNEDFDQKEGHVSNHKNDQQSKSNAPSPISEDEMDNTTTSSAVDNNNNNFIGYVVDKDPSKDHFIKKENKEFDKEYVIDDKNKSSNGFINNNDYDVTIKSESNNF